MSGPYRSGAPGALPPRTCLFCGGEVVETQGAFACARCSLPAVCQEPIVGTPHCPRCSTPFERRPLAPRLANDATVHACAACRGCFVSGADWDVLVGGERAAPGAAALEDAPPARPVSTFPAVRCPACAREMDRATFAARSTVVIDVCPRHGVWFDAGELARALAFGHEPPPPKREGIDRWLENQEHLLAVEATVVENAIANLEATLHHPDGVDQGSWLDLLFRPTRPFD